jgi:hypothetical protein
MRNTYHDETTDAQEDQVAPVFQTLRKQETDSGHGEHGYEAYNGTNDREIVDRYQGVCSFAYPPNGCICTRSPQHTHHCYAYGCCSLSWCDRIVVSRETIWDSNCCIERDNGVITTNRKHQLVRMNERGEERDGSCDENHAEQRYIRCHLLRSCERLVDEEATSPTCKAGC